MTVPTAAKISVKTETVRMRGLRRHTKEFWQVLQTVKLLQVGAKSGMTQWNITRL